VEVVEPAVLVHPEFDPGDLTSPDIALLRVGS
jgi:hypothetical protein